MIENDTNGIRLDCPTRLLEAQMPMSESIAQVNERGEIVIPADSAARYGLTPGAAIHLDGDDNTLSLRRPITQLAKVYIEPTNACNLDCVTCIRNVWDEPLGRMSDVTFDRIVDGLRAFAPMPSIFFGGFGEPLAHAHMVEMIRRVKALGAKVELITNGTLLTEPLAQQLIDARLDVLWVSIDGATPESYADVRLGAALPQILANVTRFRELRPSSYYPTPAIGIAFVAMKRNIHELPEMLAISRWLGAAYFKMSNVLPYTAELRDEMLYERVVTRTPCPPSPGVPYVSLPKIDVNEATRRALYQTINSNRTINYAGKELNVNNRCPFVESGVTAIGWDGSVSPCLPLLHNHLSFVGRYQRFSRRHVIGNVNDRALNEVWNEPAYAAFRERVQVFDFAPCTACGGCHLLEANEEDCIGSTFPTCGGCLWAQGVIQCP